MMRRSVFLSAVERVACFFVIFVGLLAIAEILLNGMELANSNSV